MADADLDHPAEVTFVRFLAVKLFFPPLSILSSLGGSHYAQPTLKEGEVTLHFRKGKVSTWNIWDSYAWKICLFSLMNLCIQSFLYQYALMDIYFILWVVIQNYFIYFVAQIVSALDFGCSFSWLLCPFDILRSMWVFGFGLGFFLTLPYFLPLQDAPESSHIFPAQS